MTEGTSLPPADDGLAMRRVLRRVAWPLIVTYALVPATFLFPVVDSTREPYFDLNSAFAMASYWATRSAGTIGAPIIAVVMFGLLLTRHGISRGRRTLEAALVVFVVAVCAGGGAAVNEHGVKAVLQVPRPNIVFLAGANGAGPLAMSAEEFYGTGDKEARREPLRRALESEPAPVDLAPAIREHWIEETGYSFPSGHAFSAMFFATFFLVMGVSYVSTRRVWWFYLLLPWAIAVCYSRPILRVHTPMDVTVGALQGLLLGLVVFLAFRVALAAGYQRFVKAAAA